MGGRCRCLDRTIDKRNLVLYIALCLEKVQGYMMSNKSEKQKQAQLQSDAIEMDQFSQGVTYGGSFEMENGMSDMTYSFGDTEQLDLFDEEDMRDKYPALKQAWEHYQSILEVCKTKEQEDEN
tara:strand:- start:498 stop:866 length:369 start_codon:yes stop_codon:yes gene_type:complete